MIIYQHEDSDLLINVSISKNYKISQCHYQQYLGVYVSKCNKKTPTESERRQLVEQIMTVMMSQFQRIKKYLLDPWQLSYKKKPLYVEVFRRSNEDTYCYDGLGGDFTSSNPPRINLCSNIESTIRHEANHWLLWNLKKGWIAYEALSEGCANYFATGICQKEYRTYAYTIKHNIPKIGVLLTKQNQDINGYYVRGPLLCAALHCSATHQNFLAILSPNQNSSNPATAQLRHQADFENIVYSLEDFCRKNPEGICLRQIQTNSTAPKSTATTPKSKPATPKPKPATPKSTATSPFAHDVINSHLPKELIYAIKTRNIGYFSGALGIGFSFEEENNVIKDRRLVELIRILVEYDCNLDLLNYFFNHGGEKVIDAQLNATSPGTVRDLLLSECNKNSVEITRLLNLFEYIPGSKKNLLGFDPFDHKPNKDTSDNELFSSNVKKTNLKTSNHLTLVEQLTIQGIVGVVNGCSYFLLEKGAEKLKKHYSQRKIRIERSVYFFAQPLLNSVINLAKTPALININNLTNLEILQNTAINFGLDFLSGTALQFAIALFKFILTHCMKKEEYIINTLIKTIFFLNAISTVLNSENPREAALLQFISSVSAILTYFLTSLAYQYTQKQVANSSIPMQTFPNPDVSQPLIANGLFNSNKPLPETPPEKTTCCQFFR